MGLYYSWGLRLAVQRRPAAEPRRQLPSRVPHTPDYVRYATAHVRELIGRYQPSVLWNDICWPAGGDLPSLFAEYYNTVPDGVINDRWIEPPQHRGAVTRRPRPRRALCSNASGLSYPSATSR